MNYRARYVQGLCCSVIFLRCCFGAPEELQKYAVKFHAASRRYTEVIPVLGQDPVSRPRIAKIKITFGTLKGKECGTCTQFEYEDGSLVGYEIVISERHWKRYSDFQREQLVFHELGHCVLHQNHRPHSVMQASMLHEEDYLLHREKYLREFFNYPRGTQ